MKFLWVYRSTAGPQMRRRDEHRWRGQAMTCHPPALFLASCSQTGTSWSPWCSLVCAGVLVCLTYINTIPWTIMNMWANVVSLFHHVCNFVVSSWCLLKYVVIGRVGVREREGEREREKERKRKKERKKERVTGPSDPSGFNWLSPSLWTSSSYHGISPTLCLS